VDGTLRFTSIGIHGLGLHACGVTVDYSIYCWGENDFGQLGDGTFQDRHAPVRVDSDRSFRSVAAGWRFTCAVTTDDEAYCWGRGVWGQLGTGTAQSTSRPLPVASGLHFASVSAGTNNVACGLAVDGAAYCWGLNFLGAVGGEAPEFCGPSSFKLPCATKPSRVPVPNDEPFTAISAGASFACGILERGTAVCWGVNDEGQLGTDTDPCWPGAEEPCSLTPVIVGGSHHFQTISAGWNHTCAVTSDGEGLCWGNGLFSKLGDAYVHERSTLPVAVGGGHSFVAISAGANHTCATGSDQNLYCWGANDVGQLGDGTDHLGLTPVLVHEGS
jgi:alpha-tubulin suppressor-like RCC1 family protein